MSNCRSFNEAVSKQSSNQTFHSFCLYNKQPVEKAGEEEKKENKTKSFVGTTNQSQQKSFLIAALAKSSLSLSLMKSFLLSFFSALVEISFLFDRSMKNLSRIVCAHHPPKRITRSLRRSTTTTLQRTRVNSSLLSTLTRVNTRKHTFK